VFSPVITPIKRAPLVRERHTGYREDGGSVPLVAAMELEGGECWKLEGKNRIGCYFEFSHI
jgi:hypothetical protein